jgi:acetyl-CoA C-acetyltransferase
MDLHNLQAFVRRAVFRTTGLYGPINGLFGFGAPVPFYAMSHQRYMHEYDRSEADIAAVSVRLRQHASEHPLAQFRKLITVEDVLASKIVSPPIRLLQAAGISTGVVVAVITSAEMARETGRPVVALKGYGEHHDPSHFAPRRGSLTTFPAVRAAASQAFAEAGCTVSDIDVAEIYGVFGATECIVYEDIGFCERGTAVDFIRDGRSSIGGDVLINPTGGRISFGHPAGATPLYEVAEVVRQLRSEAPGLQAEGAQLGLVQAEHGMNNGVVIMVMERTA